MKVILKTLIWGRYYDFYLKGELYGEFEGDPQLDEKSIYLKRNSQMLPMCYLKDFSVFRKL